MSSSSTSKIKEVLSKADASHKTITALKLIILAASLGGGITFMILGTNKTNESTPKCEFYVDVESAGFSKHLGLHWFLGAGCFAVMLFTAWDIWSWFMGYDSDDSNGFANRQVKRYLGFSISNVFISFAVMLALNNGALFAIIFGSIVQGGGLFFAFFIYTVFGQLGSNYSYSQLASVPSENKGRQAMSNALVPIFTVAVFAPVILMVFFAVAIMVMSIDYHDITSNYPSTAKTYLLIAMIIHISVEGTVVLVMICRGMYLIRDKTSGISYVISSIFAGPGYVFEYMLSHEIADEFLGTLMLLLQFAGVTTLLFVGPCTDFVSGTL